MNKIKVLQLGSSIELYGAERWILALINNNESNKIEFYVGSICDGEEVEPSLCKEAKRLGFQTHTFYGSNRFDLKVASSLRVYIQDNKISVLHTHGYKTDILGFIATRGIPCKIISTPHGWTSAPDLKLRFYELLDRAIFPFFDAVVPLSEKLFHGLSSIPGLRSRLKLVKNGVDLKEIESADSISSDLFAFDQDHDLIIGFIGRLTSGKGLDVLLEALGKYADDSWKAILVGQGEQEQELKALVRRMNLEDRVCFTGFRSDRISLLKKFDVFVLPSRSEGIPRCLMEAMAAKVPVVASDIPGCRYLIKNGETGILFKIDDPASLATSIRKIHEDRLFKNKLIQNAYDFVYSDYSAMRMGREYCDIYINILLR